VVTGAVQGYTDAIAKGINPWTGKSTLNLEIKATVKLDATVKLTRTGGKGIDEEMILKGVDISSGKRSNLEVQNYSQQDVLDFITNGVKGTIYYDDFLNQTTVWEMERFTVVSYTSSSTQPQTGLNYNSIQITNRGSANPFIKLRWQ
jgi:hypothetical protein